MNSDSLKIKYGQISGNKSVDESIYRCFEYISREDVPRFVTKFLQQQNNDQAMHTFRELLLGAYLCSNGYNARYEQKVEGKTPDWVILQASLSFQCIVELLNFHIDRKIEVEIEKKFQQGKMWVDFLPSNNERLYQKLDEKAGSYEMMVTKLGIPYVLAVFGHFFADLEKEVVLQCIHEDYGGLFNTHKTLTGVLFFVEAGGGKYTFEYFENLDAKTKFTLPSGLF
jgi:hypothetical protein